MVEKKLTKNNSTLTVQCNDKNVKIDPTQPLSIKWTYGKNGLKLSESKKVENLNIDLPLVSFRCVDRLPKAATPRPFKMPPSYIQCATEEEEENANNNETEYDLDREDLAWLLLATARRRETGHSSINEITLEKAIDMLEKESHFQCTQDEIGYGLGYLTMIDNDAPCCICNDGEDSNANQIIFCDICNIAVHQECYGVPYIPEGQWLCRRCQMSPSIPVKCALCPCTSGAFKQTSDGRWVHVVCAIWLNEVHFANTVFLEPIEGVDFSIKRRHKLKCLICKRKVGACLQCSNKACVRSFHSTCAQYAGIKMVVKESRARNNPDSITINRFVYCFQHSNPNRNGQSVALWKREMEAKLKAARIMIDFSAKQTLKSVPMPVIPSDKVIRIGQKLGLNYVNDIYSYWSLKRKSRFGVPLIRRLQVYMNQQKPVQSRSFYEGTTAVSADEFGTKISSDADIELIPVVNAQTSTLSGSTVDNPLKRFAGLRRNFERVRLLCELVKKREKIKRDLLLNNRAIVCKTLRPQAVLIDQTLTKLIDKDHQKVFIEPTNENQRTGFSATTHQLMNFVQMRSNLDKGKYKRIVELRDDFLLMIRNCTTFNKDNTVYNYGQRIKRIGMSVIKAAESEEQRMNEFPNMKMQTIELPTLCSKALLNLHNEFKIHKSMTTEKTADTAMCLLNEEHIQKNNNYVTLKMTGKLSSSFPGCRIAKFSGKKNAATKKSSGDIGKSSNTNILSERERSNDGTNNSKKGENTSKLKRNHSKCKTCRAVKKGNATQNTTQVLKNINDEQRQQQMPTSKKRRNMRNNSKGIVMRNPNEENEKKTINQRLSTPLLSSHRKSTNIEPTKRLIRKKNYANAYQTEASSAAESDAGQCDELLFASLPEEDDELPTTVMNSNEKTLTTATQCQHILVMGKNKCLQVDGDFEPSSPITSLFTHNDIVMIQDCKFPGRVIDIRMRAIDLEDEEDDYDDDANISSSCRRTNNTISNNNSFGVGRHFVDHALLTKPTQNEIGQQQHTLILFFDRNNTCKWVPNDRIRFLYEYDLNKKTRTEKEQAVVEALERARRFIHF